MSSRVNVMLRRGCGLCRFLLGEENGRDAKSQRNYYSLDGKESAVWTWRASVKKRLRPLQ